jgi:hypothetical protein
MLLFLKKEDIPEDIKAIAQAGYFLPTLLVIFPALQFCQIRFCQSDLAADATGIIHYS